MVQTLNEKIFPLSDAQLHEVIKKFPTPFHLYDEGTIKKNFRRLRETFSWAKNFREHFAVKATPNPHIVKILASDGTAIINAITIAIKTETIFFIFDTP